VSWNRLAVLVLGLTVVGSASCRSASDQQAEAEPIRSTERERLRALVQADVDTARNLHADDFQLINPRGQSLSKEQYLGDIASGQIDYLMWEPESTIDVRVHGDAAVIRYQSRLEIVVEGEKVPLQRYWHTDNYEKRNGRWQVVWSQATLISQP
jgi:ketosteroid isomerase-like protein